jgi:hypothetical protein
MGWCEVEVSASCQLRGAHAALKTMRLVHVIVLSVEIECESLRLKDK